jgi:CRP-like cAMP-binding protein
MRRLPLVSPIDRALFLKAQPYLAGISPQMITVLAAHSEERDFRPGETIFAAGVLPDTIFFLSTGGVRIEYDGTATKNAFEVKAPGGVGLMEYLACSEQPPGVRAMVETQALAVDPRIFMQLVEEDFMLYQSIARTLGRAVLDARDALGPQRPPERGYPTGATGPLPESLDLVQKLVRAREAPFFENSNVTVMTELLRFQQPRRLEPGETLWEAGDPVSSIALVLDGHCTATVPRARAEARAESGDRESRESVGRQAGEPIAYPAGSVLGAWELFAVESRAETARAGPETRILEIDRVHLTDVLEDHFEFALDYLEKMAGEVVALRSMGSLAQSPAAQTS